MSGKKVSLIDFLKHSNLTSQLSGFTLHLDDSEDESEATYNLQRGSRSAYLESSDSAKCQQTASNWKYIYPKATGSADTDELVASVSTRRRA